MWDVLLVDLNAATLSGEGTRPFGSIMDAALAIADGRIAWLGPRHALPGQQANLAREVRSLGGAWVTPGLIDCHTHLVFSGNRAGEWSQRLDGASYAEIAAAGGGILSTVRATRAASENELVATSRPRLEAMAKAGVTTVEIKSGYGLDLATELKMLRAAGRLGEDLEVRVSRTLLGAHVVPPEHSENREAYLDLICNEMIPAVVAEGLADAVDAFCESMAFSPVEVEQVLNAAAGQGLAVKLHAEQLSDSGGAALAARFGARSADHLEHLSDAGARAMAEAGVVAVLLPGAWYFLREQKRPPIEALRHYGVPMAVATDCNPGTAPLTSPLLAMNLACTVFGLSPEEALAGMTRTAARALGLEHECGTLTCGLSADLAVWRIDDPCEIAYWIGFNPLIERWLRGRRAA